MDAYAGYVPGPGCTAGWTFDPDCLWGSTCVYGAKWYWAADPYDPANPPTNTPPAGCMEPYEPSFGLETDNCYINVGYISGCTLQMGAWGSSPTSSCSGVGSLPSCFNQPPTRVGVSCTNAKCHTNDYN